MAIAIDRMELADIANPKQLAAAVIKQVEDIGPLPSQIPIEEIALGCGITDIEQLETAGFEGALITTSTKAEGVVLVNKNSPLPRRRFTIAHELGHFLNPWHAPPAGGFKCSAEDMLALDATAMKNRQTMEAEANQFAAEVLMPQKIFMQELRAAGGDPTTQVIEKLAEAMLVSNLAAARRLADLRQNCAVVLSREGITRQIHRGQYFPFITLQLGRALPLKSGAKLFAGSPGTHSEIEEVEPVVWTDARVPRGTRFMEQTLIQGKGYRLTFLVLDDSECEDDEDEWVRERSTAEPRFR